MGKRKGFHICSPRQCSSIYVHTDILSYSCVNPAKTELGYVIKSCLRCYSYFKGGWIYKWALALTFLDFWVLCCTALTSFNQALISGAQHSCRLPLCNTMANSTSGKSLCTGVCVPVLPLALDSSSMQMMTQSWMVTQNRLPLDSNSGGIPRRNWCPIHREGTPTQYTRNKLFLFWDKAV